MQFFQSKKEVEKPTSFFLTKKPLFIKSIFKLENITPNWEMAISWSFSCDKLILSDKNLIRIFSIDDNLDYKEISKISIPQAYVSGYKYVCFSSLSPDEENLIFVISDTGGYPLQRIYLFSLIAKAISEMKEVVETGGRGNAFWSPDGDSLLFDTMGTNETPAGLYKLDVNSRTVLKLDSSHWLDDPSWSPNGRQVAFCTDKGIYIIDRDGSNIEPLLVKDHTTQHRFPWEYSYVSGIKNANGPKIADRK